MALSGEQSASFRANGAVGGRLAFIHQQDWIDSKAYELHRFTKRHTRPKGGDAKPPVYGAFHDSGVTEIKTNPTSCDRHYSSSSKAVGTLGAFSSKIGATTPPPSLADWDVEWACRQAALDFVAAAHSSHNRLQFIAP